MTASPATSPAGFPAPYIEDQRARAAYKRGIVVLRYPSPLNAALRQKEEGMLIVRNDMVVSAIRDIRIEQGWTVKNRISLAGSPDAFPSIRKIFLHTPISAPYLKERKYRNLNATEGAVNER